MIERIEHQKAIAVALVEAAIESRVADIERLATADAVWWLSGSTPWSGAHRIRDLFEKVSKLFTGTVGPFTGGVNRIVAEADSVAVECWGQARFADGREYRNEVMLLLSFVDGKVASIKEYGDTELLVRLFGR